MATLIEGTDGTFKIGPAVSAVAIGYLTEVEIEVDQEIKKQGPFIGNSAISKVRGGKDSKGSAKGFVVEPMDAGQQDVIDAINSGTDVRLEVVVGSPAVQTWTAAAAIIANVKFGPKADEGVPISFDFEANGGYTLV